MKTKVLLFISLSLMASCTGKKTNENTSQEPKSDIALENTASNANKETELTYPGTEISFKVKLADKSLYIIPKGLSVSNDTLTHDITGYTFVNAEIGDLNIDGYPEIFVYLSSEGSGSYGKLIGYSTNNGKSVSQVYLPDIAENEKINKGYMGHDEMAIVENTFCQRFPIYNTEDTNAKPTGGTRQIQYKMENGESGRVLTVDKVIEF